MPPFLIPPMVKWAIAAVGGAAAAHFAMREFRRINAELEQAEAAAATEPVSRQQMPKLRRDPVTGEWRP